MSVSWFIEDPLDDLSLGLILISFPFNSTMGVSEYLLFQFVHEATLYVPVHRRHSVFDVGSESD